MAVTGIIVHHSVCPSINGKGYDYFIKKDGLIIPASDLTDPDHIHICLEGDFSAGQLETAEVKEQLFILHKLVRRLSEVIGFPPEALHSHTPDCPGARFPWSELVISDKDRYH